MSRCLYVASTYMEESQVASCNRLTFRPASYLGLYSRLLRYLARSLQVTLNRQHSRLSQLSACG
jgi:hypothetical protein